MAAGPGGALRPRPLLRESLDLLLQSRQLLTAIDCDNPLRPVATDAHDCGRRHQFRRWDGWSKATMGAATMGVAQTSSCPSAWATAAVLEATSSLLKTSET